MLQQSVSIRAPSKNTGPGKASTAFHDSERFVACDLWALWHANMKGEYSVQGKAWVKCQRG